MLHYFVCVWMDVLSHRTIEKNGQNTKAWFSKFDCDCMYNDLNRNLEEMPIIGMNAMKMKLFMDLCVQGDLYCYSYKYSL